MKLRNVKDLDAFTYFNKPGDDPLGSKLVTV
jgi:hypothetical protein